MNKRDLFVKEVKKCVNIPYIWGGNNGDVASKKAGVDCSGLVIWGGLKSGLWNKTFDDTAAGLFNSCVSVKKINNGDLIFYGKNRITHVMIFIDGKAFGATGGGSKTTTKEIAKSIGAKVCYKPISYRSDIYGIGSLPF